MFSSFFSLFRSEPSQETSQEFTTQEDILQKAHAPKDENGICLPLTNMYTKYQLTENSTKDFMKGTPQEIYQKAVEERKHQEELGSQGYDAVNSAFVDTDTEYTLQVKKPQDISSEDIADLVSHAPHSIITYPEKPSAGSTERFFHQVAVGHNKTGDCYSFSANMPGGEKIHSCDSFREIVEEMRQYRDPSKPMVVASDSVKGPSFGR